MFLRHPETQATTDGDDVSETKPSKKRIFTKFPAVYTCKNCDKVFKYEKNYKTHKSTSCNGNLVCENCGKIYSNLLQLSEFLKTFH